MGLLDTTTAAKRASTARLVAALEELGRSEWVGLSAYAQARGSRSLVAAWRSLYRLKKTLARHGVSLEVERDGGGASIRFGTKAIAELIEPDLRAAHEIVERVRARKEKRPPELEGFSKTTEVVLSEQLAHDFWKRKKSHGWIAKKNGIGVERVRKILKAFGPTSRPRLQRIEDRLAPDVVERALAASDTFATHEAVAEILGCSVTTARRFLKRHGRTGTPGRPSWWSRPPELPREPE